MLIKEKKLRQIINKVLKESIFGSEDEDNFKNVVKKRRVHSKRVRPDARWPDFVKYYDLNDIENAYKVLNNIMTNLLVYPYRKFIFGRNNLLNQLSKKLGFFVEEEIRERKKRERITHYQARVEDIKERNRKKSSLGRDEASKWLSDNLEDKELVEKFLSRKN